MAAWIYKISLPVLKIYFTHLLCSLVKYFSTLPEKFRISTRLSGIIVLLKMPTKDGEFFPTLFVKRTNFQLRAWYNSSYTTMATLIRTLELPRVVTKISSCRVNTTSRRGIKRLGTSFGSIFLLFFNKSSRGKSPAPGS